MVDQVRLTGDATPLVNAIDRGTEAWKRFNNAQTQVVKESAKLTRSGVIVTRRLQSLDSQGRKITATFKGTAGAMQLVGTSLQKNIATVEKQAIALRRLELAELKAANAARRLAGAEDGVKKSTDAFGTSLQSIRRAVGFSLLFRSVTALQQALSEGTESAIEFSRRVAEIQTIQGRTRITTEQWSSNLRELSDSFGIDILTQAEAAYQTLSNQVAKGRDTFVFLETANRLALTAVTDTASSVNLLTSAVNAFGLDTAQAEQVAAQFFKTVELGRVRVSELANIFGRVAVPAAQLGISIDEINASIAAITVQGVRSEEALTLIRNVILKLIRPTDEMTRIFGEIGVASAEAGIAAFGFGGFLAKIEKTAGSTTTALGKAFGRVRALTGALVFASDQGAAAFNNALNELNKPDLLQEFQRNFETVFNSNGEVIRRETNRLRNFFQVELGQEVLRSVADFTRNFGGVTPVIESVARTIRVLMLPALALLTARFLATGRAAVVAAGGMRAFAASNPFTLILVGAATAVSVFNELSESAEEAAERISKANERVLKDLSSSFQKEQALLTGEIDKTFRILQENTRVSVQPLISDTIAPLNRAFSDLNKDAKAFSNEIKRTSSATLKAADTTIKQTTVFLGNLTKATSTAVEGIEKVIQTTDQEVFRIRVDAVGGLAAIGLFGNRIKELEKVRQEAVRQGDIKTFEDTQKEIRSLFNERSRLLQSSDLQLDKAQLLNRAISSRQDLLKEEIKLRKDLIKQVEVQEVAANKVRIEQTLLRQDLESALKVFRSESLTVALGGQDEGQIRRSLAERQGAATRLVALQERLGVVSASSAEIQASNQRDLENAVNRINNIRASEAVKDRQDLDKQIKTRLQAEADINKTRAAGIAKEIESLTNLRQLIATDVPAQTRPDSPFAVGDERNILSEITRGRQGPAGTRIEFTGVTVALNKLIATLDRDPTTLTPEALAQTRATQRDLRRSLEDVISPGGQRFDPEAFARELQAQVGTVRRTPTGAEVTLTQERINEDIRNVRIAFESIENTLKALDDTEGSILDQRRALQESNQSLVQATRELATDFRVQTTTAEATAQAIPQSINDLLTQRRQPLGTNQLTAGQLDPDSVKKATTAATPQLAASYKSAVQGAAPDVRQSQIDAVLAAEKERQNAAKRAAAGPEAAQTAAKEATKSAFLSRKIQAEKRAQERKDANDNARRIQDERIKQAAEFRSQEAEKIQSNKENTDEQKALAAAGGVFGGEDAAQAALAKANQADLNRRFGVGDPRSTRADAVDPLAVRGPTPAGVSDGLGIPIGVQPLQEAADGGLELATSLDTATSRLDIFNETLQAVVNGILAGATIQERQIGETDSAIQSLTFDDDGGRTAQIQSIQATENATNRLRQALVATAEELERRNLENELFFTSRGALGAPDVGGFAEGGGVPGVGNTDSVRALLTPGEFVVNKQSTRRFLPDLVRMNSMKPRRFQDGGRVGDINFGGFQVTESKDGTATAREIERIVNRGVRQGTIKIRS